MFLVLVLIGQVLIFITNSNSQETRCVLPGTCFPFTNPTIDFRIVVPSTSPIPPCPPGLVPCKTIVRPQCGVQYVQNISRENGKATPGAYPWQAYISNQTGFTGSGVLLNENHVLTAAHKVYKNLEQPFLLNVRFGVWDPNNLSNTVLTFVEDIYIPSTFNMNNLTDDIAILKISPPAPLATNPLINSICLPKATDTFSGKRCIVSGYGQSQFQNIDSPNVQKQVEVPVVDFETCWTSFTKLLGFETTKKYLSTPRNLCAGGEANKDACTNDGGGPLMCLDEDKKYVVAGLVLWGKGCGDTGVYGVYANVANYREWIDGILAEVIDN